MIEEVRRDIRILRIARDLPDRHRSANRADRYQREIVMGITFGDHLIDSGRYEFTPEEERERDEAAAGMIWWNALDDKERKSWMERAGNTGCAFDAWRAFKQEFEARDKELRDSAYDCPCGGWDCSNLPEGPLYGCPHVAPRQPSEKNQDGF